MSNFDPLTGAMIQLSDPFRLIHIIKRLPNFQMLPHSHNFFHIIFVTSGVLEITLKGNTHLIHENQAVVLPPYVPHALSSKKGYSQIGVDIFDSGKQDDLCGLINQIFPSGFAIVHMHMLSAKFDELQKSARDLTKLNLLKLANNAEALVLSFLEQGSGSSNKNFKEQFLDMVVQDESLSLSLTEMCLQLGISKTHLERLVREEFGCSVMEYYSKLKFMKACFFLQNTDLSIRAISEKLGLYDESHFTRFFKKQSGITPTQYRNNSRTLLNS